jgi:hypothetical protein
MVKLGIKLFALGVCIIIAGVIMAVMRIRADTGMGVAALGILVAGNGLVLIIFNSIQRSGLIK